MTWKVRDYYTQKAKKDSYLARSAYKLEEIDKKFSLIKKGNAILDLGYFPGSWIQYALSRIGRGGLIVGVDILPVNEKLLAYKNVKLFEKSILDLKSLGDLDMTEPFDSVISDMAPKTTGVNSLDQDRSLELVEAIFDILPILLKESGNMVVKVFESHGAQVFFKEQRKYFQVLKQFRPKSTRSASKETFFIGKGARFFE